MSKTGKGRFVLYHGNLTVNENKEIAIYLIEEVFNDLDFPLIIAGKNPPKEIRQKAEEYPHIKLLDNPSDSELNNFIQNAHINILPTFYPTGIKLKLLNALFKGRFCLVNSEMIRNTGLEKACIIANGSRHQKQEIKRLFQLEFTGDDVKARADILIPAFDNIENAKTLLGMKKKQTHND